MSDTQNFRRSSQRRRRRPPAPELFKQNFLRRQRTRSDVGLVVIGYLALISFALWSEWDSREQLHDSINTGGNRGRGRSAGRSALNNQLSEFKQERKEKAATNSGKRRWEKLQYKLQRVFRGEGFETNETRYRHRPLWEMSEFLPPWMKEYFAWHREKRQTLTEDFWRGNAPGKNRTVSSLRFLVVQCLPRDHGSSGGGPTLPSCGSLSERLSLLPYWLRVAHEMDRVLFLHWAAPTDLSDFLEPPVGGCDWRAPLWMRHWLGDNQEGVLIRDDSRLLSGDLDYFRSLAGEPLVRVQLRSTPELEERYNDLRDVSIPEQATLEAVFHDVWRTFFVPSEHIQKSIENTYRDNGMVSGEYVSIDLTANSRSILANSSTSLLEATEGEQALIEHANRVVECACKLRGGGPFLAVSSNLDMTRALQSHKSIRRMPVFARYKTRNRRERRKNRDRAKELLPQPLMDFDSTGDSARLPDPYYDVFVNLFLMSMGHGVVTSDSRGVKTLSRLANWIGYDSSRYNLYTPTGCVPIGSSPPSVGATEIHDRRTIPESIQHYFSTEMMIDGLDHGGMLTSHHHEDQQELQHSLETSGKSRPESNLPQWMEEYFEWHRSTKKELDRSNWKNTKYLVLVCLETHSKCGGISDRLKPLPMVVWEAFHSQRLLLILWDRPKPLEEWLIPPDYHQGGIDWIVPSFLKEKMGKLTFARGADARSWEEGKTLRETKTNKTLVTYQIQKSDAGEKIFFEEQQLYAKNCTGANAGSSYRSVFRHLWRRLFRPNPRLEDLLESKRKEHGLVSGQYAAVHLRAMYGNRVHRDPQESLELAVLGVNCASNLFPGAPIYFASDTSFAVEAAQAYATLHGLSIVSMDRDGEANTTSNNGATRSNPIHLDKDKDWRNRPASAYDATFIDLYMLAESRCVAWSNGGYGTFGSLLSHDPDCQMRFFKGRKKVRRCLWTNETVKRQPLELPSINDISVTGS
ncbi:unnamed protein product [Pseudo-nitzschia multistriata]|uniref:Uncharacterized protein n=1 Tax=Pseudo-nitzschia multistriata TaxID=183589 RepID=A0A448ZJW0_9STRA|nr:unnamed protein product [Pseudo-nitzschia multistriata]